MKKREEMERRDGEELVRWIRAGRGAKNKEMEGRGSDVKYMYNP